MLRIAVIFFDMKKNSYKDSIGTAAVVFWAIVLLLLLVALASCTHRVYVPLETVRTDTVYRTRHDSTGTRDSIHVQRVVNVRDSVTIRDSVVITRDEQGNVKERLVIRYRDRWRMSADNVTMMREIARYRASNDSLRAFIRDMQQVPVPVERKTTVLQKFEDLKHFATGIIIGAIIAVIYIVIKRFKSKYEL